MRAADNALLTGGAEINSNFIEISVHLFADDKAGAFGADLRSLLPVYLDSFFSLPVIRADGTKLDFEDVVRTLDAETLSYTIDSGRPLQEDITIRIKVTKDKYTIAIGWLRDLLWGSQFSAVQRLTISANKAIQNLPSEKRDGSNVAYNAYRQLVNGDESINAASNLFNRVEFLPAFVARLKDEPQAVVAQFEQFRRAITDPRAMRIAVKGDILSIDKPATAWLTHFEKFEPFEVRRPLSLPWPPLTVPSARSSSRSSSARTCSASWARRPRARSSSLASRASSRALATTSRAPRTRPRTPTSPR